MIYVVLEEKTIPNLCKLSFKHPVYAETLPGHFSVFIYITYFFVMFIIMSRWFLLRKQIRDRMKKKDGP